MATSRARGLLADLGVGVFVAREPVWGLWGLLSRCALD